MSNDISKIEHNKSAGFFHDDDELNVNGNRSAGKTLIPAPFAVADEVGGEAAPREETPELMKNTGGQNSQN